MDDPARAPRRWPAGLLLAAALLLVPAAAAQAARIVDQSFCLGRGALDCTRPVPDGQSIPLAQLPVDESGRRVVYFYSVVDSGAGEVYFHAWERDGKAYDVPQPPKLFVPSRFYDWVRSYMPSIRIPEVTLTFGKNLLAVLIRPEAASPRFRAYSERVAHGASVFVAKVIGTDGQPLPNAQLRTLRVTP